MRIMRQNKKKNLFLNSNKHSFHRNMTLGKCMSINLMLFIYSTISTCHGLQKECNIPEKQEIEKPCLVVSLLNKTLLTLFKTLPITNVKAFNLLFYIDPNNAKRRGKISFQKFWI